MIEKSATDSVINDLHYEAKTRSEERRVGKEC